MSTVSDLYAPPSKGDGNAPLSAREAISHHYDNDTAFFSLWLDETLSYSAARWRAPHGKGEKAASLAAAQVAKIDFHLDAVRLPAGASVLDVGCGWGAVLERAVTQRGAARAVGLTLSQDQYDHVAAKNIPGIEVRLEDFFAYDTTDPFDAVVSIGAFEHFARPSMGREEKIAVYRVFFEACRRLMKKGGYLSLQTIVWDGVSFEEAKQWIPQAVFPESDIPFIEEVVSASHESFRLEYLENQREDYIDTLEAWIENLRAARATVLERWGEEKYKFFEDYLRNSKLAFQRRKNSLARFTFRCR